MLSDRHDAILKIVINDYVATATPIGSQALVKKHGLALSPATVRNVFADLEDAGYITHPHTSAGRVPSDRGYRYFVETLPDTELADSTQRAIRARFEHAAFDIEEWNRVAANILAEIISSAALVTTPKAHDARLRHIELVEIHATLALLIVVLREARVKQQMLTLAQRAEPETLQSVSSRLNGLLAGAGLTDIDRLQREAALSALEQQVVAATARVLRSVGVLAPDEVTVAGLPDALALPEFNDATRAQQFVGALNPPNAVAALLADALGASSLQVVIGQENREHDLRSLSLVVASYGAPGEATGLIGLVGPTRMPYDRAIPAIRFVASLLTDLVREVHGDRRA